MVTVRHVAGDDVPHRGAAGEGGAAGGVEGVEQLVVDDQAMLGIEDDEALHQGIDGGGEAGADGIEGGDGAAFEAAGGDFDRAIAQQHGGAQHEADEGCGGGGEQDVAAPGGEHVMQGARGERGLQRDISHGAAGRDGGGDAEQPCQHDGRMDAMARRATMLFQTHACPVVSVRGSRMAPHGDSLGWRRCQMIDVSPNWAAWRWRVAWLRSRRAGPAVVPRGGAPC